MASPAFTLRLSEDRCAAAAALRLAAAPRVLFAVEGAVTIAAGIDRALGADTAWHGASPCVVTAGAAGGRLLRYELLRDLAEPAAAPGVTSRQLLAHVVDLDPRRGYLMRCDRVDFDPGGEALPHRHRGGGIRWLLAGELEVRVGKATARLMRPGDAWFESGREPVHAIASKTAPTSFIRVAILPREIRGQSSIVYVDPAHAAVKPRRYRVYVDEPVDLA
ncbi:MAG: cupin domain-containing protein [Candidatus Rokubacteria bacterium]|nr:cupin domain-containing protein [Candidatus Rokubacteria bacterium]MBI3826404.1 cupin domain-containing protein [Candidatus Rokubacteria bacterium]